MRSKASSVSTSASVARIAASESTLRGERAADAADVGLLVGGQQRLEPLGDLGREAVRARPGSPPPIDLPTVSRSGSSPYAAV